MISYAEVADRAPRALRRDLTNYEPKTPIGKNIMRAVPYLPTALADELIAELKRTLVVQSCLRLVHNRKIDDGLWMPEDHGIVSEKVITDTGVAFLVDAWQNTVELENMKYHGIGTGGAAEVVGNTALTTELTTQYNPDSTRATGSLTEASAPVFRSVGTNAVDASVAITEHGLLSQAATGGGVLWDRSLFSAVNLASGDSLQSTYDATFTSGG